MNRILDRITYTVDCWFWQGGHNAHGRPYYRGKLVYRLTYEHFREPIPDGLVLDHEVCDNPACVNPYHLTATTQRQNLIRAGAAKNLGKYLGKCDRERDQLGRFCPV